MFHRVRSESVTLNIQEYRQKILNQIIEVLVGDITQLDVAVIVNAANSRLAGGGGVDGAIHEAAGYEQLHSACAKLGGCPTGEVRLTPGFNLPARAIIHAVGPVWHGGHQGEPEALRSCYRNAMGLAAEEGFDSIAFSAISCGVYAYPHELAVDIAVSEVLACLSVDGGVDGGVDVEGSAVDDSVQGGSGREGPIKKVVFCCFNETMARIYRHSLSRQAA